MPSREEAKSVVRRLHALSGSAEIVRKAAARELARRDPLDSNELLHHVLFLARGGWEPATCVLSSFVAALGQEAAHIPYADSLRRMAEVQSLESVADLFQTAPAVNYALAMSGIRFRSYLIGTLIGLPLPIAAYCIFFDVLATRLGLR